MIYCGAEIWRECLLNNNIKTTEVASGSMGEYLTQVIDVIRTNLEQEVKTGLERHVDPEIDDRYLVFYVDGARNPATLEKIEKASNEVCPLIQNSSGWILITQDFKGES